MNVQHNDHLFQVRAGRYAVPVIERAFTPDQVGESRSEYKQHVRDTILAVDFSTVSLSTEATEVLETTISEQFYGEDPPMSDGLEGVLAQLNAADHVGAHSGYDEYTTFPNMYAIYDGIWYEFELTGCP